MVQKMEKIWFNGKLVPWDEAQVHVLTHTLHYGAGVFEGIRAYECADGRSAVFRLEEHIIRLEQSAHILGIKIPYSVEEMVDACIETLQANNQKNGYLRPLAFIGEGAMGVHPADNPINLVIATWPWGAYLGEEALAKGIRVCTSSYARHHVNVMMTKSKCCGNYVNSVLAKTEAVANGYDEAILLDTQGYVAEGSGENLFMVRDEVIYTPPLGNVLGGFTRDSIITLAQELGYEVREQAIGRDMLYIADEAFFTGTAAEVTPIREVDRREIGKGQAEVALLLQKEFFKVVKGENQDYSDWLEYYEV